MASHAIGKLMRNARLINLDRIIKPRYYSLYTPDYLETGKSKIPLYVTLDVQLRSYAYPILENYQKFIYKLTEIMDIDIDDSWAFPAKSLKVQRFKPNSSAVVAEYAFQEYQRHILLSEVSATQYLILLRALEAALPESVTLSIEYYNPLVEEKRYVPDTELLNLKGELEDMKRK